jgi:hypothetical protein
MWHVACGMWHPRIFEAQKGLRKTDNESSHLVSRASTLLQPIAHFILPGHCQGLVPYLPTTFWPPSYPRHLPAQVPT